MESDFLLAEKYWHKLGKVLHCRDTKFRCQRLETQQEVEVEREMLKWYENLTVV